MERKISSLLELAAYEYRYRDIVYIGEEARFLGIKHLDKRLLFAVDFHITAGVDLDSRELRVLPLTGGGVRVELPAPGILTVDAAEESIRQYFVKEFGGQVSRLEYYDRIAEHKREARQQAIADGIVERAGTNARTILASALQGLGIEPAYVVFRPREPGGPQNSGAPREGGAPQNSTDRQNSWKGP